MSLGAKSYLWTVVGAIVAALAASLCCILPVVAAALGMAGFAASGFFAAWRPYLLALTFVLLGAGFYVAYTRRGEVCEPGSLCQRRRFVSSSRAALWVVAGLVILFGAFPYYSGTLVRAVGRQSSAARPAKAPAARAALAIQGMDCTACAALIENNLAQIKGVRSAKVSFEKKVAIINYDPRVADPQAFVKVVEEGGYKAAIVQSQGQD